MSDVGYELVISATARHQLAEVLRSRSLPAYEFSIGPLPANPHRVGKRPSLHSATDAAPAAERTE